MMYYCIILVNVSLPKGGDRSKGRLLGIIPVPVCMLSSIS